MKNKKQNRFAIKNNQMVLEELEKLKGTILVMGLFRRHFLTHVDRNCQVREREKKAKILKHFFNKKNID